MEPRHDDERRHLYGLLAHGLIFGALFAAARSGPLRHRAALGATALALVAGIRAVDAWRFRHAIADPAATGHPRPCRPAVTVQCADRLRSTRILAIFYTTATLGFGPFDPYAPDFSRCRCLAAVAALGLLLCWRGQYAWLMFSAHRSSPATPNLFANLWDALIDPLLVPGADRCRYAGIGAGGNAPGAAVRR